MTFSFLLRSINNIIFKSWLILAIYFPTRVMGNSEKPTHLKPAVCPCDRKSDSLELINFFTVFDGDQWAIKTNWTKDGSPLNTWYGVRLNSEGCVVRLDLESNKLLGIMYDIKLPALQLLNLGRNQISGLIPDFTFFSCLEDLRLDRNKLTGHIEDFANLPNLNYLYLFSNKLSGDIPDFSKIPRLVHLDLFNNELSTNNLDFSSIPDLEYLRLSFNKISGKIPNFLHLKKLVFLDLSFNTLSGSIPDFTSLDSTVHLDLSYNEFSDTIPNFNNLPKLSYLNLSINNIKGNMPNFAKVINLKELWLGGNNLSGSIPAIPNKQNFLHLDLSNNHFTGLLPDLTTFQEIKHLNLANNKLTDTFPIYTNLINLIYLNLSNNALIGRLPDFSRYPEIIEIYLAGNSMFGNVPNFTNNVELRILDISNNQFEGVIPSFLNNAQLLSLKTGNNKFTFSDFYSNKPILDKFTYHPQRTFFKDTLFYFTFNKNDSIDLVIDNSISENRYTWLKNSTVWTPPLPNNGTLNKLVLRPVTANAFGRYTVQVTNTLLPKLTLESSVISIKVCNAQKDFTELVKLYDATNGNGWTNNKNWKQVAIPLNQWHGIQTDSKGCVRSIKLDSNNLRGSLPDLSMNSLDTFNVSNNFLGSNIPNFEFPFIRSFNISSNTINGKIPDFIPTWTNLTDLNLSKNNLTNNIPPDLADLCEAISFKLNDNQFTGEIPEELTKLQKLINVDFRNNLQVNSKLSDRYIFFCKFGPEIFTNNNCSARFDTICLCTGNEFENIREFPWLLTKLDSLQSQCQDSLCFIKTIEAGFVEPRQVKLIFIRSICRDSFGLMAEEKISFFNCGGNIIENASRFNNGPFSTEGYIVNQTIDTLDYKIKWRCGDTLLLTSAADIVPFNYKSLPVKLRSQLKCQPNPAVEFASCYIEESDQINSCHVFSITGITIDIPIVMQKNKVTFDVSQLPQGIYMIQVQGKERKFSRKLCVW